MPQELRGLFIMLALVLGFLVTLAMIAGVTDYLSRTTSSATEECWQLQTVDGRTYKINTCSGEMILLERKLKGRDKQATDQNTPPAGGNNTD